MSRFQEALANALEPRHLFLILSSCVAYWIFFSFSLCSFFSSFPCLRGQSVFASLEEASCAAWFAQENPCLFNQCDRRNWVEGAGCLMVWGFHFQFAIIFSLLLCRGRRELHQTLAAVYLCSVVQRAFVFPPLISVLPTDNLAIASHGGSVELMLKLGFFSFPNFSGWWSREGERGGEGGHKFWTWWFCSL